MNNFQAVLSLVVGSLLTFHSSWFPDLLLFLSVFFWVIQNLGNYLKFTYESSETNIPFLDLKVILSNGELSTDLHIKSTDRQQFLHYTSSHPDHTKRSIIYSQALRISRIGSNKSDFLKHIELP